MKNFYDVIIVGAGAAGLSCILNIDSELDVCLISKKDMAEANSYLAQGGISAKRIDEDIEDYVEDTLKAGHYENDECVVREILDNSLSVVDFLIDYGVPFDKNDDGSYNLHKEGGHRLPRVYHVGDFTGRSICETLARSVCSKSNIEVCEDTIFYDLIAENNRVEGIKVYKDGKYHNLYAKAVVIATGGIGGIFDSSTNYKSISGEGLAIAIKHGVDVSNIEYIQIHPTVLYNREKGRHSLITEALRGEGGILVDKRGQRFIDELRPRDIVSKAIRSKMESDKLDCVYLSLEKVDSRDSIDKKFPTVFDACIKRGIDIRKDMIPVCPGQHYHMGGIRANINGQTSMKGLYAIGEVACTGLHGKNRLASNSLLEASYCGIRCGETISRNIEKPEFKIENNVDTRNIDQILEDHRGILVDMIRERNRDFYEYWLKNEDD